MNLQHRPKSWTWAIEHDFQLRCSLRCLRSLSCFAGRSADRLAVTDLYRGKWTNQIHDEWIRNLLARRPELSADRLAGTRELMNRSVRDSLVFGYEHLNESIELPDPDDRHVVAAAIHSGSERIITFNMKDFPASRTLSAQGLTQTVLILTQYSLAI